MNAELQADLAALTETVRRFTLERMAPHVEAWEKAGMLPRELHREAATLGLLGLAIPRNWAARPASYALRNALSVTMARHSASGGVMASLFSHNIGLPPILRHGSSALQREIIPPVLRGERIAALAITERENGI
jgi:acyl-CoA dehydrogenase